MSVADRIESPGGRIELPRWAQVTEKRTAHIARVTALMDRWAAELGLPPDEARAWRAAALWHDALRDAGEEELRELVGAAEMPAGVLHGPASALRLEREGESRSEVLEAVRWHTVGHPGWGKLGRALFMADYLEPGRNFMKADRAFLATVASRDFDGAFRQVVRARLEWTLREGNTIFPETVELWNLVR